MWHDLDRLDIGGSGNTIFESWHPARDIFTVSELQGSHDMRVQAAEPEIIIFSFYNDVAYRHIISNGLNRTSQLDRLRDAARSPAPAAAQGSVPSFPAQSSVVLTAWWPVARDAMTALPVWDPELNPARAGGNSYITWARVVAVDATRSSMNAASETVQFAGRTFNHARRAELDTFHRMIVDEHMAERLARDARTRKAALIALGRPLQSGDHLVLVAMHVATKESNDWSWTTVWWHDQAERGEFAQDRPPGLSRLWRNYLLDVAADEFTADGAPRVCFNPWLEARFPQGRQGTGVSSNCVACHRRASYPPVDFLPVTRGAPDFIHDPAFGARQLRTDFLWSLARQAQ